MYVYMHMWVCIVFWLLAMDSLWMPLQWIGRIVLSFCSLSSQQFSATVHTMLLERSVSATGLEQSEAGLHVLTFQTIRNYSIEA